METVKITRGKNIAETWGNSSWSFRWYWLPNSNLASPLPPCVSAALQNPKAPAIANLHLWVFASPAQEREAGVQKQMGAVSQLKNDMPQEVFYLWRRSDQTIADDPWYQLEQRNLVPMAQFCLLSNICFKPGGGREGSRDIQAPALPWEAWVGGRHPWCVTLI